ncbi:hypothetical protein DPMN_154957 [Dreissena polymorpha]|uniref:Uncharacterized protein n=1 Tax=Dreissena polymorpha TaxID=45954 RepID=A0A9D4FLG7_DREPO|nr:hypothetical protein DPMN_154957 [Dreissena polymorpha]
MKLRNAMVPATIFWEPISLCFTLGLMNAWAVSYMLDLSPMSYLLVHTLLWFLLDYTLIKVLEVSLKSFNTLPEHKV